MDVVSDAFKVIDLHGENNEVLLAGLGGLLEGLDVGLKDRAVVPMKLQSLTPDRGEMRSPVHDGNGFPDKRKFDRKHAANRAGPDDADFHVAPSCLRSCSEHSTRWTNTPRCVAGKNEGRSLHLI